MRVTVGLGMAIKGLRGFFGLAALGASLLLSVPTEVGASYVFGAVPQFEQRRLFAVWRPILDELEKQTGLTFELVGTPTIPLFEKALLAGTFDFVYLNPYHFLLANRAQGYRALVRDTARDLRGILVVRKDSSIQHVRELDGKPVAFPAPNALGASLLMRADLHNRHRIQVVPKYVLTHTSVYLNVLTGLAAAGGGVHRTLQEQPEHVRDALRIVYTTRGVPPHPVAVHPRVPKRDQEKVRRALLQMGTTARGKDLLRKVPIGRIGPAALADYKVMEQWGLDAFYVKE